MYVCVCGGQQRKKKVKIPYPETELAVTEAVDRVCLKEDRFANYNVSNVGGKAEYVKGDKKVGNKQYKTELMNMCQVLALPRSPLICSSSPPLSPYSSLIIFRCHP